MAESMEAGSQYKTVNQAARHGQLEQMKKLIAKDHPVDAMDNRGWRPLHEAASANHIECVRELLQNEKTDVSWTSYEHGTALYLAAEQGHKDVVSLLLDNGADPNQPDIMKNTPLIAAIRSGSIALIRVLLEHGANINCQQYTGSSPLHLAAAEGRDDIVQVLLDSGARLDIYEDYHISPIFTAAQYGQRKCLEMLLECAKKRGQSDMASMAAEDGGTPLYLAAQEGHVDCVKALLANGADPNALTIEPVALPLHAALEFGHANCVDVLLPVTNRFSLSNCDISPWSFAMNHSDPACLHSLIKGGMDVNFHHWILNDDSFEPKVIMPCNHRLKYSRKVSPLVALVVYHCPLRNAKIMLEAGASVHAQRVKSVPPLLAALNERDLEYTRMLISHGAPVNEYHPNCLANMTLITALYHWKSLNLLLKAGADPTLNFSTNPMDIDKYAADRPVDRDYESESDSDEEPDDQQLPLDMYTILRHSSQFVSKRAPTAGMILYQMLQYVTNVMLDPQLESLIDHPTDWQTLLKFTVSPRSLMHLCRVAVRRTLRPSQLLDDENIRSLPLPETVVNHLLYTELDPEEPPPK